MAGTTEGGTWLEVEIEVPRWSMIKRQAGQGIEYISPIPCPYNYGFVPGVIAPDGEFQDAIVLGARLPRGTRQTLAVQAIVRFLDDGVVDDKLVCAARPMKTREGRGLIAFFTLYAAARALLNRLQGRPGKTQFLGLVAANSSVTSASMSASAPGPAPRNFLD